MLISERHNQIICQLRANPNITVNELAEKLCFSEPTIRRDFTELHRRGIITKRYGGAVLNEGAADREIPFVLKKRIYAVASLCGAFVYWLLAGSPSGEELAVFGGVAVTFLLRVLATIFKWNLPKAI